MSILFFSMKFRVRWPYHGGRCSSTAVSSADSRKSALHSGLKIFKVVSWCGNTDNIKHRNDTF